MTWIATGVSVASAVGGGIMASKSAKKNLEAQKDANEANIAAQKDATAQNYAQWLMTKGVGTNGQPINTKMPLWMQSTPFGGAGPRFRKAGSVTPGSTTMPGAAGPTPPSGGFLVPKSLQPAGKKDSTLVKILDPIGLRKLF